MIRFRIKVNFMLEYRTLFLDYQTFGLHKSPKTPLLFVIFTLGLSKVETFAKSYFNCSVLNLCHPKIYKGNWCKWKPQFLEHFIHLCQKVGRLGVVSFCEQDLWTGTTKPLGNGFVTKGAVVANHMTVHVEALVWDTSHTLSVTGILKRTGGG